MTDKHFQAVSNRLSKSYQLLAEVEQRLISPHDESSQRAGLLKSKQKIEERISELEITLLSPARPTLPDKSIHSPSFEILISYLEDPDPAVRFWALGELAASNQQQAYPYLLKSLKDSDPEIRVTAVEALARFGRYAVKPLLALFSDRDYRVRNSVVTALACIGPTILPYLINILKDEMVERHVLVVATLRETGPVLLPQLHEMLRWPYSNLVYSIVTVIGDLGNDESLTWLQPLADGQWQPTSWGASISEAARNAIRKIRRRKTMFESGKNPGRDEDF
jgi:HEAT repeat protein